MLFTWESVGNLFLADNVRVCISTTTMTFMQTAIVFPGARVSTNDVRLALEALLRRFVPAFRQRRFNVAQTLLTHDAVVAFFDAFVFAIRESEGRVGNADPVVVFCSASFGARMFAAVHLFGANLAAGDCPNLDVALSDDGVAAHQNIWHSCLTLNILRIFVTLSFQWMAAVASKLHHIHADGMPVLWRASFAARMLFNFASHQFPATNAAKIFGRLAKLLHLGQIADAVFRDFRMFGTPNREALPNASPGRHLVNEVFPNGALCFVAPDISNDGLGVPDEVEAAFRPRLSDTTAVQRV